MTTKIEDYYYTTILELHPFMGWDEWRVDLLLNNYQVKLDGTQVYGPIRSGNIKINDER